MKRFIFILLCLWLCVEEGSQENGNSSRSLISGPAAFNYAYDLPRPKSPIVVDRGYLHEMRQLSLQGRFYNQSEKDFEALKPKCSCISLPNNTCPDETCYCQFECPIPENSFTGELFRPKEAKCWAHWRNITSLQRMMAGRMSTKDFPPSMCDNVGDIHDYKSKIMSVVCTHIYNLRHAKNFYNVNPGWALMVVAETERILEQYNWPSAFAKRGNISGLVTITGNDDDDEEMTVWKSEDLLMRFENLTASEDSLYPSHIVPITENINFTKELSAPDLVSIKVSVAAFPEFVIQTTPKCSEIQKGRSFEECNYTIQSTTPKCSEIRSIMNYTRVVVSHLLTNSTFLRGLPRPASVNDSDERICVLVPSKAVITMLHYKGKIIGTLDTVDNLQMLPYSGSYAVAFTLEVYQVTEAEFRNLPRFWRQLVFEKCMGQFCWRDLMKIKEYASKPLSDEEKAERQIYLWTLMAIPFLLYLVI